MLHRLILEDISGAIGAVKEWVDGGIITVRFTFVLCVAAGSTSAVMCA